MKINPNKYYIAVENRIYSLTEKQYEKFKNLRDKWTENDEGTVWDDALKHIEKVGKLELTLFTMFRY
jgi:hypothetical protein